MVSRLFIALGLAVAAAVAAADPVVNLANGTDLGATEVGGSYSYSSIISSGSGKISSSPPTKITKPAGALDASANIQDLFPQFGANGSVDLTGTNLGGGKFKWDVTAPSLIGQTITVTLGNTQISLKVTSVAGELDAVASDLSTPQFDVGNGVWRSVSFKYDQSVNLSHQFIEVQGLANGAIPVTIDIYPKYIGLGGISPLVVSTLSLNPNPIPSGTSGVGTVVLSDNAPNGGATVALSSNSAAISVPASVQVAQGGKTATFNVNTSPVSADAVRSISASLNGLTVTLPVTLLKAVQLSTFTVSNTTIEAGQTDPATVTLNGNAPTGGAAVSIVPGSSLFTVPSSVTVPAGTSMGLFNIGTKVYSGPPAVRSITASYNGVSKMVSITINPTINIVSFTANPSTVKGGTPTTGTVTISSPAPTGGVTVNVDSASSVIIVPLTVTIPAGATSVDFTINTKAVSSIVVRTATAHRNGSSKTVAITLTP